ncbi:SIS domain-containing protein [Micromonospora sp. NBC_01796]|uniref:SIS domain-containing protein n=1 Tax=Micromonospora sp. NBC_01796 TaxID=2975987 RepID=UPI002DD7D2D3|nr:SIS domain-containing protein [Micromonospora sp. NBC_01796]WSA85735.1 SIS domain-containing protein [Micromonospora sp. NBC_01796]
MTTTTISAPAYLAAVTTAIERVTRTQADGVRAAADLITTALDQGGVVQAFGCGHSEALSMEIAGRAGGLVPTNKIALRDLVLYGGADRAVLDDPLLERDPSVAHRLYELAPVKPDDVFVLTSNSGVNGVIVEFALLVKDRGHRLIGITSLDHTSRVESRHPSGRRLADIADVVLDNGAPYGDAALPIPGGGAVGAISSITGALLAQQIVTEVVAHLLAAGQTPPIYLSANVPGGDTHNNALEARYAGRIRRTA